MDSQRHMTWYVFLSSAIHELKVIVRFVDIVAIVDHHFFIICSHDLISVISIFILCPSFSSVLQYLESSHVFL
jgi:hypothetical protein